MKVVYARKPLPKSIFLAGPTPRSKDVPSWRPEALRLIESIGFDGTVFTPEDESWVVRDDYDSQIHWEWEALKISTVVLFWVPRDIATMPAFVTNVEFGYVIKDRNVVLGWPEGAPKNRYLQALADRHYITPNHTLEDTIREAITLAERPFAEHST